jgi:hypothetical protein
MLSNKNNIVYQRPQSGKTYTERLSNEDIKIILKDYIIVDDITKLELGTHIRYFTTDEKTRKKKFRLGGMIVKIDPLGRFIMLSNGQTQPWSAQINNGIFYKKLSEEEKREELKKEIMSEINLTKSPRNKKFNDLNSEDFNLDLKKKNKIFIDKIKNLSEENNILKKQNEKLIKQINKIQIEIEKKK